MATDNKDVDRHIDEAFDWEDFKEVLITATPKDRLYAYLKLLEYKVGRRAARQNDNGEEENDKVTKIIDDIFKK